MRYNSEALEIKAVISGNSLLFKDIKISLGLLQSNQVKRTPLDSINESII